LARSKSLSGSTRHDTGARDAQTIIGDEGCDLDPDPDPDFDFDFDEEA